MSISEAVVEGEAIESDNESEVEFSIHNKNSKVTFCFELLKMEYVCVM